MQRRSFFALLLGSALTTPAVAAGRKPNVIIILADDLGYGDLGVQGGRDVATPNIDRLAADGVRMTDFYSNHPSCAPARAALLSGRYQHRFGFENNPGAAQYDSAAVGLPRDHGGTLPERLKAQGYATAAVGKWHIGFTPGNLPTARGFDRFYGFLGGAMAYTPDAASGAKEMWRGVTPAPMPAHTTEAFADESVAFIQANRDRPFFLYAAFNAVHAPLQSTKPYLGRFAGEPDPKRRAYLAMLAALDDAVGRIVGAVDEAGLGRDTLIVFTSDNGGPTWQTTSRNGPLNGVKGTVLEGGRPRADDLPLVGPTAGGEDLIGGGNRRRHHRHGAGGRRRAAHARPGRRRPLARHGARDVTRAHALLAAGPAGRDPVGVVEGGPRRGPLVVVRSVERHRRAQRPGRVAARGAGQAQGGLGALVRHHAQPRWGSLNRTGQAQTGEVRGLIDAFVRGQPVDPRSLLYGGGPE